ncbi:LA2681 family HEPN domain-containing protein [Psychrobacter piscatorii]|uniref:LA2681 family HEPN domain-containing protein n=1 Tax=Psychrobacter piscatorii TaxID=554343 RepID=UPI0037362572
MEDSIQSKITYTNLQLDNASKMIDRGQFEESYKLCLYLKELLGEVSNPTEPSFYYTLFRLAGLFVDIGHMASKKEASYIGLEIMESDSFENCLARDSYYYCLGNAKGNLIQSTSEKQVDIDVKLTRQLSEVSSLFLKAILICRVKRIETKPQYLVNLANNLKQQYRISEALALYDQVIAMNLDIAQAWVNRSECLISLNSITKMHTVQQGKEIALGYRKASASKCIPPDWARYYSMRAEKIDSDIEKDCSDIGVDLEDSSHLDEQEYQSLSEYRRWCLVNFLSLSEHGLYCKCYGSARDNLNIPVPTRAMAGDFILPMEKVLNRLKSEFGLARLMLYEYKSAKKSEYIDDDACYAELYDNELLGTNIEKLRTAFRICFGILDKIGNAIALLFDLQPRGKNNKVRNASFHTFWELDKKERLEKFNSYGNAGLIGLYSTACDLNYSLKGELNFYKQWRNALEHSFVFIYDNEKPENIETSLAYYEEPVFISESEFVESAEHVLQLTRSAIFSFVFAVRIKSEKGTPKNIPDILIQNKFIEQKKYI